MTQRITKVDEWNWQMKDNGHQLWPSRERGEAKLEVRRYCDGSFKVFFRILAAEEGEREKKILMHLNPDTVRSLIEWLNACAQKPAINGGDAQGQESLDQPRP